MLLLALFILIQLADVWTTYKGFQRGDTERLPVGKSLFANLGFWPTVALIKGTGVILAMLATAFVAKSYWFTGPLNLIGLGVLVNNILVLRKK